jgi:hypothetical protein
MWVKRDEHQRLVDTVTDTASRLAALQSTLDWMTTHLNQVERERAELFAKVTGVGTAVPVIRTERSPLHSTPAPVETPDGVLSGMSALFEDMGDESATRLGVHLDSDGVLR